MKKRSVALLVSGALVAGLTLGGLGIASAATRSTHKTTAAAHARRASSGVSAVATLSRMTGLSVKKIQKLRHQGRSYASIATSMGLDPAAVVDRMLAARQAHLDALLAAGRMTAAQEQTMFDAMRATAETMMGMVPGTGSGMSRDTTPSMPATPMAGSDDTRPVDPGTMTPGTGMTPGAGAGTGTGTGGGMMTAPTAPSTPSAPSTGMMGSGSGMGR